MTEPELLFTQALNCDRGMLYLNRDKHLSLAQAFFISSALKRRIKGEPIQYILGKTEFMGLEFRVNKDALIPRADTEILVEAAQRYAGNLFSSENRILELGTGSGCIAISLAKFLPSFEITATDISLEALKLAKVNAGLNKVADRVVFLLSDLFNSLALGRDKYSMCVSNPPYIPTGEISRLPAEVKYEPRISLDGGSDGINFYRRIIKESFPYLKPGGFLIMEIGFNQKENVAEIIRGSGFLQTIEVIKDYNNFDRVIVAKKGR